MLTIALKNIPQKIAGLAFVSSVALGFSACIDIPAPGPKASAPLPTITAQTYRKVFSDGSLLGDAAVDWSCVKDSVTGLVWERKSVDAGPNTLRQNDNSYTWYSSEAAVNGGDAGSVADTTSCDSSLATCDVESYVNAVNASGLCGATNWRLPTREELLTLVDRSGPSAINSTYFDRHDASKVYWTQNTYVNPVSEAWTVGFTVGEAQAVAYSKSMSNHVRLVRGSWATISTDTCGSTLQSAKPDSIYDDSVSGVVTDKQTGLMWQQAPQVTATYAAAQAAADANTGYGYSDWRLPNINELNSLVDVACSGSPVNVSYFALSGVIWSSTVDAADAGKALTINFATDLGNDVSVDQSSSNPYLLVRTAY